MSSNNSYGKASLFHSESHSSGDTEEAVARSVLPDSEKNGSVQLNDEALGGDDEADMVEQLLKEVCLPRRTLLGRRIVSKNRPLFLWRRLPRVLSKVTDGVVGSSLW